jgi:hypothetical protein
MSSTQTTVKHYDGPIKVLEHPGQFPSYEIVADSGDLGGSQVAMIHTATMDLKECAKENAYRLVKCWNTYDELLEALKEEKKFLECLINIVAVEHTVNSIRERLQTIEAVIQKATH